MKKDFEGLAPERSALHLAFERLFDEAVQKHNDHYDEKKGSATCTRFTPVVGLGIEEVFGLLDFKVCGFRNGV